MITLDKWTYKTTGENSCELLKKEQSFKKKWESHKRKEARKNIKQSERRKKEKRWRR